MNRSQSTSAIDKKTVKQSRDNGFPERCCLLLLKGYKFYVSPFLPPSCRFTPTCSEYAMEAVQRYGFFRGLRLSLFRLLRCHPFCKGGYDPVK